MPSGVVSVGVLADFAELIEQSDAAGLSIEAFSGKVVTSSRTASKAMVDFMKTNGASADEMKTAAAEVAAAWDASYGTLSKGAKSQAQAAMMASRAAKESADQQSEAYAQAAAAAQDAELKQKAAADAVAEAQGRVALATKALADAQEEAAAKVDLVTERLGGLGEGAVAAAAEITKIGAIGFAASIAGMGDLAAKYQEATESIAANSGISSKAAANIGKAFLTTSGTTIYSAKELTESFATVSGQLKSTEGQALGTASAMKVMSVASNLGEATGESLGSATSALSMVMQGYKLSVSQAAGAGDLLFNTSRQLDTPMNTVAQAINKLHGRLGDLAPSLGDVGGLMVELGSHGVQGSRGVSVMNTAFQTLVGGSQQTDEVLSDLGVKIFNAQGKFVGLQSVIAQLQPKMASLTQQQQDLASKTLFGSSASQVMLSVIERGPAAFAKYVAAAEQQGSAAQGAADQTKTFAKQFDILKASIEDDATSIGLKLLPALTGMSKGLDGSIQWLAKNKTAADALGIAVGTVLATAVSVFAVQKGAAFIASTKEMYSGLMGIGTAAEETDPQLTTLQDILATLQGELEATEAQALATGGAFQKMGADAQAGAGEVKAADAEMDTANTSTRVTTGADDVMPVPVSTTADTLASKALKVVPIIGAGYMAQQLTGLDNVTAGHSAGGYLKSAGTGAIAGATAGLAGGAALGGGLFSPVTGVVGGIGGGLVGGAAGAFTDLLDGGSSNSSSTQLAAADTAIKKLQTDLKGVASPADLSAQKLAALYKQAEQILNMPDITAKQRAGLQKLSYQLDPDTGGIPGGEDLTPAALAKVNAEKAAGKTPTEPTNSKAGNSILNIATGGALPAAVQADVFSNKATQEQDVSTRTQAVGSAQVTALQAINQQLQDQGQAEVQKLSDLQTVLSDKSAEVVQRMSDLTQKVSDASAAQVQHMQNAQQLADDAAAAIVQQIKDQTQVLTDRSAVEVAAIQSAAQIVSDSDQAAATLISDNSQTEADQLAERGLYGLTLLAQQYQVDADKVTTYWDQQIALDQEALDTDQQSANVANAQAQLATDQVTAAQDANVAAAQQNVDLVTLQQDAAVAKAQQHADAVTLHEDSLTATAQVQLAGVTAREDMLEAAAKAHSDAVAVAQDNLILKATQHADAVQLGVDTSKIGPAQVAVDMNANASKAVQTKMQNQLNLATSQGSAQVNSANAQLASVTSKANSAIASAQNTAQGVANAAETAIQTATNNATSAQNTADQLIQAAQTSYSAAQDSANQLIQSATDAYDSVENSANAAISTAQETQASTAAMWAKQLATDQATLTGTQGQAGVAEASAGGLVTTTQAEASTQFAGSGLTVNVYGVSSDPQAIGAEVSWALRANTAT